MIGVAARAEEQHAVREFFELFKTPWEPVVPGRRYRAVLRTDDKNAIGDADVLLLYAASQASVDDECGIHIDQIDLKSGDRTVGYRHRLGAKDVWRVRYDLFAEVRTLLTTGQPGSDAATPTLELHIELLRQMLRKSGVTFVEVPPRPSGYAFTCCLTHDIDFVGIRRHTHDRTLAGFAMRASVGSAVDVAAGRRPLADAARNAAALVSLPLVFMKVLPDFWQPFAQYAAADRGHRSTFFLVPFKGRPGRPLNGHVEPRRAVAYGASDVRDEISSAHAAGHEVAVHGIDAWHDAEAGRAEQRELAAAGATGVRMHWLYFGPDSPRQLEAAGFEYDSTCGYNDAVGFRAGTSQAFKLEESAVMELPLAIMDSALFFPDRMGLSPADALRRCEAIVEHVWRFGGTVVVNWHDRSLAPERLWGRAYGALLDAIERHAPVWFATAREAVRWFAWRRSVTFAAHDDGRVTVRAPKRTTTLPAARVWVHDPARSTPQELLLDSGDELELAS